MPVVLGYFQGVQPQTTSCAKVRNFSYEIEKRLPFDHDTLPSCGSSLGTLNYLLDETIDYDENIHGS